MTAFTLLGDPVLLVEAGEEAACEVLVRNEGAVVDQFAVDVVGETREWATAVPEVVNLMPGGEATVTVRFAPPRGPQVAAGSHAFGVRLRSREYPDRSAVVEGHVEVAPFLALDAELLPARRRGSRKAKYRLAVENAGNTPVRIEAEPFDPEDDQVRIRLDRTLFTVPPGTVALLRVLVRPFERFLRGDPRPHPFELKLIHESADGVLVGDPLTTKGLMTQERMLPKWVLPSLALLSALAIVLTTLWFAVLAPNVKEIASSEVAGQVSAASSAAEAANAAASKANGAQEDAHAQLSAAAAASAANTPTSLDFRIATFAAPVADSSFQQFGYSAPPGRAMDIYAITLQNPRQDKGFIRVSVGSDVLLESGLANFTDQPYSYAKGLHVPKDVPVTVSVDCVTPGAGSVRCTPSASFSAQLLPAGAG
ncbi:hypothetical protein [Amycolatopsis sp. Hca4]|uniref:COG1470 family protein n=1 Tax=Amycolatopsis sp. Hca4 TaxID=2742131 RepID=UPI00158FA764|nr:hypothetical protein [Amycolatopsis sp. Hca4]QKV73732.1 hypothetical protein HUT10_08055 [Amycolatopsis sp. Hca4]